MPLQIPRLTKTEILNGKPIKTTATMKKIYTFLMSAVALVSFAACSEGLNEITVNGNETSTEVTLFAEFENDTRMTLNDNIPEWEAGDVIYINGAEFIAQTAGRAVLFKGSVTEDMIGQAYTAYFGTMDGKVAAEQTAVAGHMSKETPATAEITDFQSGMTISFKNAAALLQFTPSFSGDVIFNVVDGETVTLKGCEAGNTYYAAVTPATWSNGIEVTTNNGIICKEGAVGQVVERNKIYPLGAIDRKVAPFKIIGSHNDWTFDNCEVMYETENYYVAHNFKMDKGSNEFKFISASATDLTNIEESYGSESNSTAGNAYRIWNDSEKLISADDGTYDIYMSKEKCFYFIMPAGAAIADYTIKLDSWGIVGNIKDNEYGADVPFYVCGKFVAVRGIQPVLDYYDVFQFCLRKDHNWDYKLGTSMEESYPINEVIPLDGINYFKYEGLDTSKQYDVYTNFSNVQLVDSGSDIPTSLNFTIR